MQRRRLIFGGLAAATLSAGVVVRRSFRRDLQAAKARVATGSTVIDTTFGALEYATAGGPDGPAVIMIHGTGGGFDQGLAAAGPLADMGHRIIAPSRFGYLRSALPADASSARQANAIVALMDHLGIAQAGVIGLSAGARAALALGIRHPDRCSALIALVPATHVPGTPVPQPGAIGAAIMRYALHSDFLFWAGNRFARDRMIGTLLATDPALLDGAEPAEQARANAILAQILPVSARSDGFINDARLSLAPEDMNVGAITVPTLAISLQDDRFGTFPAAQYIAQTVPGARLVSYPSGGHVFIGHAADIYAAMGDFLDANPPA